MARDRRRLVDVASDRTLRRLAEPAPRPVIAIATSSDGYVAIADAAGGVPEATVFSPNGAIADARRPLGRTGAATKLLLAKGGSAIAFEASDGWTITSLASGHEMAEPGDALVWDVAFAPGGHMVALATPVGILFAALRDLVPRWRIGLPSRAIGWFGAGLFPDTPTVPF